ncbi:MAG: hypothetical protein ACYS8Z_01965 [Planctomycetota bacterium]|jgi:hypothetical protein
MPSVFDVQKNRILMATGLKYDSMKSMFFLMPTKSATSSEYGFIFWSISLLLAGFGLVCLFFGYRAPVEKAEEASKLIRGGYAIIAAGVGMHVVARVIRSILARL